MKLLDELSVLEMIYIQNREDSYQMPYRVDRLYLYGVVIGGATTSGTPVYASPARSPNATVANG